MSNEPFELEYSRAEMIARAAQAGWISPQDFREHWRRHKRQWPWVFPKGLAKEQYEAIRMAVLQYPDVHVFTFQHKGQPQWGFYCEAVKVEGKTVDQVGVIYDVKLDAIMTVYWTERGIEHFRSLPQSREVKG